MDFRSRVCGVGLLVSRCVSARRAVDVLAEKERPARLCVPNQEPVRSGDDRKSSGSQGAESRGAFRCLFSEPNGARRHPQARLVVGQCGRCESKRLLGPRAKVQDSHLPANLLAQGIPVDHGSRFRTAETVLGHRGTVGSPVEGRPRARGLFESQTQSNPTGAGQPARHRAPVGRALCTTMGN